MIFSLYHSIVFLSPSSREVLGCQRSSFFALEISGHLRFGSSGDRGRKLSSEEELQRFFTVFARLRMGVSLSFPRFITFPEIFSKKQPLVTLQFHL